MFPNLGNIGQIAQLMKNAGQIKQNMAEVNDRLSAARFTGESGGGQVKATVDGKGELLGLKFETALVRGGDVEMLEDLAVAAVRDAVRLSRQAAQKELEAAMGGVNLSGLMGMLGGGNPAGPQEI